MITARGSNLSDFGIRPASETILYSLAESECACWLKKDGAHIVCHRGRYWHEVKPGFYDTVHLLARLAAREATRPAAFSWGFRATLETRRDVRRK